MQARFAYRFFYQFWMGYHGSVPLKTQILRFKKFRIVETVGKCIHKVRRMSDFRIHHSVHMTMIQEWCHWYKNDVRKPNEMIRPIIHQSNPWWRLDHVYSITNDRCYLWRVFKEAGSQKLLTQTLRATKKWCSSVVLSRPSATYYAWCFLWKKHVKKPI